jgi:hypothetical protein
MPLFRAAAHINREFTNIGPFFFYFIYLLPTFKSRDIILKWVK